MMLMERHIFKIASSDRLRHYTAQPSERRNAPWYVWDMYSKTQEGGVHPVFVGTMEECHCVADALNQFHGNAGEK